MRWVKFIPSHVSFISKSNSENYIEIRWFLTKLQTKISWLLFHGPWCICAFVALSLVFPYQVKRLAWGTSPKWPILCRVGRNTTTQWISLVGVLSVAGRYNWWWWWSRWWWLWCRTCLRSRRSASITQTTPWRWCNARCWSSCSCSKVARLTTKTSSTMLTFSMRRCRLASRTWGLFTWTWLLQHSLF